MNAAGATQGSLPGSALFTVAGPTFAQAAGSVHPSARSTPRAPSPDPGAPWQPFAAAAGGMSAISGAAGASAAAGLLLLFGFLLAEACRRLTRQTLLVPAGIVLSNPVPPG